MEQPLMPPVRGRVRPLLATLAIACGIVSTGALSADRLLHTGLPGCGAGSGCAAAAESRFALVHRLPVAHLGVAYACAMALGWFVAGRQAVAPIVWAARAGALISSAYLGLMAEHGYRCGYCIATHAANLTVWVAIERMPRAAGGWRAATALALGFGLTLGIIAVLKPMLDGEEIERQRSENEDAIGKILPDGEPDRWLPVPAGTKGVRIGPADAPVRVTVFLDYQCGFCRAVARDLAPVAARPGVAITWRQLPHGWPCNPALSSNVHDCACRAARLAAAAGGTPDFASVHEWLLARNGVVQDEDIEDALPALTSADPRDFWARYHAPATRDAVREDIELARQLGLTGTPAVYVNGVPIQNRDAAVTVGRIADRLERPR